MKRILCSSLLFHILTHSAASPAPHVRIEVLDRGQPDGIATCTPYHKWVVIDGGTNREQAALLKSRNVDSIELAAVSHRYFDQHDYLLGVDVLKASNLGSNNGYTDEFLSTVSTDSVVISAGVNDTYNHPMEHAVQAYSSSSNGDVYWTYRHSTIRVMVM